MYICICICIYVYIYKYKYINIRALNIKIHMCVLIYRHGCAILATLARRDAPDKKIVSIVRIYINCTNLHQLHELGDTGMPWLSITLGKGWSIGMSRAQASYL